MSPPPQPRRRRRPLLSCERLEGRLTFSGSPLAVAAEPSPVDAGGSIAAETAPQWLGPLRYEVYDGGVVVAGITEAATEAVIPPVIDGLPVTAIGAYAFFGARNLVSVTIPNTVTHIHDRAFMESGITNLTLPRSVTTIGIEAFEDCDGLTRLVIPASVVSVGRNAFEGCSNLASLSISAGIGSLPHGVFSGCTSLRNVTVPHGITGVGPYAFADCTSLTNVSLPDTVLSIGSHAFSGCTSLVGIALPGGVASLGDGVFRGCTALERIVIPRSVTTIEPDTFSGCTALSSVSLPGSVQDIGALAFYQCASLTRLSIPASVARLGNGVFGECTSLGSVDFLGSPPTIVEFYGNPAPSFDIGPDSPLVVRYRAGNSAWSAFENATFGGHAAQAVADLAGSEFGLVITVGSIEENTAVSPRRKVADVVVPDAAGKTITLMGESRGKFRVDGSRLFLRAGVQLDYESKKSYQVKLVLSDPARPEVAPATIVYRLQVLDVNEPPTGLALANVVASLPSATDMTTRIKLADLVILDDALRNNLVTLSGADARFFRVVGSQLFFRAGTTLDAARKRSYTVTIAVEDPLLTGSEPVTRTFSLDVTEAAT